MSVLGGAPIIAGQEVRGEFDFETYSEGGQVWNAVTSKWEAPVGAGSGKRTKGLGAVGTTVYAQHPTAEVLTLSYKLPPTWWNVRTGAWAPGGVTRRWRPGLPNPQELFDYLASGGLLEAHKVFFERSIWRWVCVPKYGWPSLEPFQFQLRCSMAKARVNALPGALANLSDVLALPIPKDAKGKALLDKYSVPRNPTAADPRTRIPLRWDHPGEPPQPDYGGQPPHPLGREAAKAHRDAMKAYERDLLEHEETLALAAYCDTDIDAEEGASERMYPLTPGELQFWMVDQEINWRGVAIDRPGVRNCIAVLHQVFAQYGEEFRSITGGLEPTQLAQVKGWLAAHGVHMETMDEDAITERLKRVPPAGVAPMAPHVRRVLEIRQLTGSASVKKLFAMELQAGEDNRLHDLIQHHGARTGRPTGEGPQPLNLPKAGPDLAWCDQPTCHRPFRQDAGACPWCFAPAPRQLVDGRNPWFCDWGERPKPLPEHVPLAADFALEIMAHRDLAMLEMFFGNALLTISGCIRSLFCAGPGLELIASDYSAIEAVVIAVLAGEQWRIDAFKEGTDIYVASAAKITGKAVDWYKEYALQNGHKHPDRQKIGKVAELGLGFGGWIGAWLAFDDSGTYSEDQIKRLIVKWRAESPAIVEFWGGQFRGLPWDPGRTAEMYGVEGAAVQALQYPGVVFDCRGIKFQARDGAPAVTERVWEPMTGWGGGGFWHDRVIVPARPHHLFIKLLSGRELTYRHATLEPGRNPGELSISYWTWNSNPKYGAPGWVPMNTFGGRLVENIVQATAHDILRFAILNLRMAGYPTVLHVYDEVLAEVPRGTGNLEVFERIMATLPAWARDWPIRAMGGWIGFRYRK